MSRLRIYGDQSGYLDLVAPDSARNNVINLDGLINKDSNGNVGIGTDTPDTGTRLHIVDSDVSTKFKIENTNSTETKAAAIFLKNTAREYRLTNKSTGSLEIKDQTAGLARVAIDTSGNVGIGTSTPEAALHVKDATSGAGRGLHIDTGSVGLNDDAHILFNNRANYGYEGGYIVISDRNANGTSTSKQFKISLYDSDQFFISGNDGRVGIGTNAPQTTLDVNGDLRVQGNFTVDGTTTTINSTTLNVDDLNITVASGAPTAADANGAGLTVDTANATLTYVSAGDNWSFNKDLNLDSDLIFTNRVATDGHIKLYNGDLAGGWAIGIEGGTLYNRSGQRHRWYIGTYADGGTSDYMELTTTGLDVPSGTIQDTTGNVRTPRYAELIGSSNHNLTNEGVYVISASSTFSEIIIGDGTATTLTAGTIMTIYNNRSTSVTISRGSIPNMRNAADGDYTNYPTRTLGRNSVTTVTMFYDSLIILTGTDIT